MRHPVFVMLCLGGAVALSGCENNSDAQVQRAIKDVNVIDESNLNDVMLTVADPEEAVAYFTRTLQQNPDRIDVQRGLFDEEPRPFEADMVVDRINALTARARLGGVPVFFIQHERATEPLQHGSQSWQLERRLHVEPSDQIVRKTTPDSFLRTELQALLERQGIDQVIICGYACEFCVDTTVRRAAALGYGVVLAADAHTTHDKAHASAFQIREHHNATLPNISSFGSRITSVPSAEITIAA